MQGQILASKNQYGNALREFDDSIATFDKVGSRLVGARARFHRAALRLKSADAKEREAGRVEAESARAAFADMDAARDHALAEQLLAA